MEYLGLTLQAMKAKNVIKYFQYGSNLEMSLNEKDLWAFVLIGCFSLALPYLWLVIPAYALLKCKNRKQHNSTVSKIDSVSTELEQIVLFIQSNRLQSLTEAIELNPNLLYCLYKKQSLLYWCKFHNNTKALMVVVQLLKKHPENKTTLAA